MPFTGMKGNILINFTGVGQQCRLEQSRLQKITIPTKKVKIMPTTTIPTLMPTPTIPTTCVNCGHSKKTKLGTKFDVGNFNFQLR